MAAKPILPEPARSFEEEDEDEWTTDEDGEEVEEVEEPPPAEEPPAMEETPLPAEKAATPLLASRASTPRRLDASTPQPPSRQPSVLPTPLATPLATPQPSRPPTPAPELPQPALPPPRRVAVITGATSGVGLALALRLLASDEWDVVAAARESNPSGADTALALLVASIRDADSRPPARLSLLPLDLACRASVADFSSAVLARHAKVDTLFLNAALGDVACGPLPGSPTLTPDGVEQTFAVNHLGHALLTRLLLPSLVSGGRVIVTSCSRHRDAWRPNADDWQAVQPAWWSGGWKAGDAYNNSKLCGVLFALKLHRELAHLGVTALAVDPGLVTGTRLLRDRSPSYGFAWDNVAAPLAAFVTRVVTPEQAAGALAAAAARSEGGVFLEGETVVAPAKVCCEKMVQDGLWDHTNGLLGIDWPAQGEEVQAEKPRWGTVPRGASG